MKAPGDGFLKVLISLWLRLSTVAIVGLLFVFILILPPRLAGWRFYLSAGEVAFEVAVFAAQLMQLAQQRVAVCQHANPHPPAGL